MQPTGGARAKARSAEPCEPASRGKEQCGAALRGHACDDISRIRFPYRCLGMLNCPAWQINGVTFFAIPGEDIERRVINWA